MCDAVIVTGSHFLPAAVVVGLRREHVSATGVARPALGVRIIRNRHRQDSIGRTQLGQSLDPGHVFPQREGG